MNDAKPDVASLPAILHELDILLATQGKLQFARENYDEAAATVFGVALLDFLRVHGMEVRRRLATTEQPGSSVQGEAKVEQKDCPYCTQAWFQRDAIYRECLCGNRGATPPPAPAAERLARCHDCHEPTAGQHICLGCAELRTESVADAVRSVQPEARGVEGMVPSLPGNWPEDASHENGDYECKCIACGATFYGHKRRVVCKVCATPNPVRAEQPEVSDALIEKVLNASVPGGSQVWWSINGGGMKIDNSHRTAARRVIEAFLAAAPAAPGVRVDEAVSRACHPYVASDGSMHASLDAAERHDAPDGGEGESNAS